MKTFPKLIIFLFFMLSGASGFGQNASNVISIGTVDSVYSQVLKENRRLFVYVPEGRANPSQYPVVYLLDGGANFSSFVGALQYLSEVNMVCPPMIVVGILNTDRMRDFTPSHIASAEPDSVMLKTSGGGEMFTTFLEKELIPYINRKYSASPERMLIGHSLGGLLAINTFIYHTDLFKHYISIDPSLTWDKQKLLKKYLAAIPQHKFKDNTLFLTAANFASLDSMGVRRDSIRSTIPTRTIFAFADALKAHKESSLDWACRYYVGENHFTVPVPSEYDALKFIFRKKTIQLTSNQIKELGGKYKFQFDPGKDVFLQVTAYPDYLVVKQLWDGKELRLLPESELRFFSPDNPFTMSFVKASDGVIKQVLVMNMDLWTKVEK